MSGFYMKPSLKTVFSAVMILIIVLVLFESPVQAGNPSGRIVVCLPEGADTMDPTNHRSRITQLILKNIYDSLTTVDKDRNVVPQLAEAWKVITPTEWEFRLKKGVLFHNGDPLTADDVRFTLMRVTDENGVNGTASPRKSLFEPVSGIRVIDEHTFRITTEKPWPILPMMLSLQEIIPENYFRNSGSERFINAPVGTGPYRFIKKAMDGSLELERFSRYYGEADETSPVGKTLLKQLVFKVVPDNARRIIMLKRGAADIITNVPPESLPLLEMDPKISIVSQPATRSYFADINCAKAPFDDRRIRIALNNAIDMTMIVKQVIQGKGRVLPTVLLPEAFSYNTSLTPYPYAPEYSRKLLKDAGFPADYQVKIVCIKQYETFANTISLFLSRVGIRSVVKTGEKQTVRNQMLEKNADILVTSWGNTTLDPLGIILPKFKYKGRGNFSNYHNEEVEILLKKAENALNPEKRKSCYNKIQEIVYNDAPMIFGYAAEEFYGVRLRVGGFQPSSTGMLCFHDVYVSE